VTKGKIVCHRRQTVLQFALARIVRAALTRKHFGIQPGFDRDKLHSGTFGRFTPATGHKEHTVRLLFEREMAPWVTEKQWGPGQKTHPLRNGQLELSFRATGLFEVQRWVLQYSGAVTVVKPPALRREVARRAALAAERNI